EKLEEDKKALALQIEDKKREIEELKKLSEELMRKLVGLSAENSSLDEEYKKLDEQQGQLYLKKAQINLRIEQLGYSEKDAAQRTEELKAAIEELSEKISVQKKKLLEIEEELETAEDEKSETENKMTGYKKLFESKSDKLKSSSQTLENLKKEYDAKRSRYDVLDGIDKNMAGFAASVKSVVAAAKQGRLSGIRGTVADIINVDKRYTVAIEIALGGVMQNVVTDNEDAAKRSMRYLKENNLGRATFLPLTSVNGKLLQVDGLANEDGFEGMASDLISYDNEYDGIVKSILGKTAVVEDIDVASFIAKKYGYRFKIVTLDGQVINAGGSFTGGSVKNDAGIISRKQELTDLLEATEKLSAKIKDETEQLKPLQAEVNKMAFEMEGFAQILAECAPKIARLEAERDGVRSLLSQLNSQRDMNEELLEKQDITAADGKKLKAELETELSQLESTIEKNEAVLQKQRENLDKADSGKKEIADKISENDLAVLACEKDIEALLIRIDGITQSVQSLLTGGDE
ncbi:MAG: chromosome segregation protein SMC, partial [Ruminiclostridium sp.]|nr:chromosome segregation protein SMC [Ruminiclostridium sp.]